MALPVTIQAATSYMRPGHHPPFLSSAGNVYYVGDHGSSTTSNPAVYKATDPTSSFSEVDAANAPTPRTITTGHCVIAAVQSGDVIHMVFSMSTSLIYYYNFDMSTDSWGSGEVLVANLSGMSAPAEITRWCSIAYRPGAATEIVIAMCDVPNSDMGGNYESVSFWHMADGGTSFTGPVSIAQGNATVGSYDQPQLSAVNAAGKIHVFYNISAVQSSPIGSNTALRGRTISATNTLSTAQSSTNSTGSHVLGLGNVQRYIYSGSAYVGAPISSSNGIFIYGVEDGNGDMGSISGSLYTDSVSVFVNGEQKIHAFAFDPVAEDIHMLYSDNVTSDLFKDVSSDNGASWGTDLELMDGITCNRLSANVYQRGSSYVLAYVYEDAGAVKYNEFSLTISSMSALSDGNITGLYQAFVGPFEV